jgi:hypothetical protein
VDYQKKFDQQGIRISCVNCSKLCYCCFGVFDFVCMFDYFHMICLKINELQDNPQICMSVGYPVIRATLLKSRNYVKTYVVDSIGPWSRDMEQ